MSAIIKGTRCCTCLEYRTACRTSVLVDVKGPAMIRMYVCMFGWYWNEETKRAESVGSG